MQVWIDPDTGGQWLGYPKKWMLVDNYEFEATLTIEYISWRYSSRVRLIDEESGAGYNMFIADLQNLILTGKKIENAKISGTWTFIKRGQEVGVKLTDVPREVKNA